MNKFYGRNSPLAHFLKGSFTYDVRFLGKQVGQAACDFTKQAYVVKYLIRIGRQVKNIEKTSYPPKTKKHGHQLGHPHKIKLGEVFCPLLKRSLLKVANVDPEVWTTVPMQGSGTFSVEAVVQTATPRTNSKVSAMSSQCSSLDLIWEKGLGFELHRWQKFIIYNHSENFFLDCSY